MALGVVPDFELDRRATDQRSQRVEQQPEGHADALPGGTTDAEGGPGVAVQRQRQSVEIGLGRDMLIHDGIVHP